MENENIKRDVLNEDAVAVKAKKPKKINKKSIIIISAIVIAFLAVAAFFACYTEGVGTNTTIRKSISAIQAERQGNKDKIEKDNIKYENPVVSLFDKNKDVVIKVNGALVDEDIFSFFTNSTGVNCVYTLMEMGMLSDVSNFDWEAVDATTGLSYKELSKGMALESVIPVYATMAEGEKRGIKLEEAEEKKIRDWIDEQKESYGEEFEDILKKSGYKDEETLYEVQYLQVYMQKVYEDITNNLDSYFTPEMKESLGDEKVTVKHILILAETDEAKPEAKKKAEAVLEKAKNGEDFEKLIKEYNEDPGATDEGYTFANDGTMVQEFTDASFALKVGEISDLVETSYGYHIIKRLERTFTAEDYISSISKSAVVRVKKGIFDKMTVTINLNDYFGETVEPQTGEASENAAETEKETE